LAEAKEAIWLIYSSRNLFGRLPPCGYVHELINLSISNPGFDPGGISELKREDLRVGKA
jgi:hypothetical protein